MADEFLQTPPEFVAQAFGKIATIGYGGSTEQTASPGWLEVKVLSLLLSDHITPWQRTGLIPVVCS